MKRSLILTALLSIFLMVSCTSFSALGNGSVNILQSPDLTADITGVRFKVWYFEVDVEIGNIGSQISEQATLEIDVKVYSRITIDDETTWILTEWKTFDLSENISELNAMGSINATFIANSSWSDSIIYVRVNPNGLIGESIIDNNSAQFIYSSPRSNIIRNPVLTTLSRIFPRAYSLLCRIFGI